MSAIAGPLKTICQVSKLACDALTPMVRAFYTSINASVDGEGAKLKADASVFTIADGIVQHLLVEYLFTGKQVIICTLYLVGVYKYIEE